MAIRTRPLTASAVGAAITAIVAVAALTGCGTVTATTSPGVAARSQPDIPATLCAATSYVDSLTISRTNAFPSNHLRFTFPPKVTTSAAQARIIAKAVCALPRFPHKGMLMSCPNDWGISYRLSFATTAGPGAGERRFPPVTLDATGCEQATGAGPQRWMSTTPRFWTLLGTAMGVADPQSAFGGCTGQSGDACPKNATYTA